MINDQTGCRKRPCTLRPLEDEWPGNKASELRWVSWPPCSLSWGRVPCTCQKARAAGQWASGAPARPISGCPTPGPCRDG